MVMQSLAGLPAFLTYFCVSIVACILYLLIYTRITAHDEFKLVEANVPGAAIALGLSLLGFAIPLASAIAHSASVLDCAIWALIALVVQIIVYFIVRIPVSNFSQRMQDGEIAPAIWLGLASLSAGVLNAACMTY
jgi:putative membrane protein